jgi:hypothetical protein
MMAWHGLWLGSGLDIDAWLGHIMVVGLCMDIVELGFCCEWTLYLVVVEETEHEGMTWQHLKELTASMHSLPNIFLLFTSS